MIRLVPIGVVALALLLVLASLPHAATPVVHAATFTVTNTNGNGPGSLTQAILDANASPGPDTVVFNIPGSGPHVIRTLGHIVTDPLTIDGSTQPGFSGVPIIELEGNVGLPAITLNTNNSNVRGLSIGNADPGLLIRGSGNAVEGSFIGLHASGANFANGNGIIIQPNPTLGLNATNNRVGGGDASKRNVISGNAKNGIFLRGATGTRIEGNFIGVDPAGTSTAPNGDTRNAFSPNGMGVWIADGTTGTTVGGPTTGLGNVISGNGFIGVYVSDSNDNAVQGNRIGPSAAGGSLTGSPQRVGVVIDNGFYQRGFGTRTRGRGNMIGGAGLGQGNDVQGATSAPGLILDGLPSAGVVVRESDVAQGTVRDNPILGNAIRAVVPILLAPGASVIDALDADDGPNRLQNRPVLTEVQGSGPGAQVRGTIHTVPNSSGVRVEVFESRLCTGGAGDALRVLGSTTVNTDAGGDAVFSLNVNLPAGQGATATATVGNNTSQLSNCLQNTAGGSTILVTTTADEDNSNPAACSIREAIRAANTNTAYGGCAAGSGADEVRFAVDGTFLLTLGQIDITSEPVILRGNGRTRTVIDANSSSRAFQSTQQPVTFEHLSIKNGSASDDGGAFRFLTGPGGTPGQRVVFRNVELIDNRASRDGGAIRMPSTVDPGLNTGLDIEDSVLSRNRAGRDGGAVFGGSSVVFTRSTVSENEAVQDGGAVAREPSGIQSFAAIETTFRTNRAGRDGGAVSYSTVGFTAFTSSVLTDNRAGRDGGALAAGGAPVAAVSADFRFSEISGNQAGRDGGGIFAPTSLGASIADSTISGNRASSGRGGGFFGALALLPSSFNTIVENQASAGGGLFLTGASQTLASSIVAQNTPGSNCAGTNVSSGGFNISSDASCAGGFTLPSDRSSVDPQIESLASNGGINRTHALRSTSPAIDAVPLGASCDVANNPLHARDQRGVTRPVGARCDVGAFETTALVAPPSVAIGKIDAPDPVGVGQTLTYTILVANASTTTASGVTVSDVLPPNVSLASVNTTIGSCSGTSTVSCTLGSLEPSAQALISINVVPLSAAASSTLSNTASVSINGTNAASQTDASTTTMVNAAITEPRFDLSIVKTGPSSAEPGAQIVYVLTVTNTGPDASTAVTVTDPVPSGLAFVSNTGDCTTAYPCALGTLAAGQSRTITSTYQVSAGAPNGTSITNVASVSSSVTDTNPNNNSASATTTVSTSSPPAPGPGPGPAPTPDPGSPSPPPSPTSTPAALADVSVTKVGPASLVPGTEVTYLLTVTNLGPGDAAGVRLEDPAPSGLSFLRNTGDCVTAFPCAFGTLGAGQQRTVSATFQVSSGAAGQITNVATVSSSTADPNPTNNTASLGSTISGSAQPLGPTLTPSPTPTPTPQPVVRERDPQPRKLTEEQRQQQQRTDRSSQDDTHIEGDILSINTLVEPPELVIGTRDGRVTLRLHEDAAEVARGARVGQYFVGRGEKQHEGLWDVYSGDVE